MLKLTATLPNNDKICCIDNDSSNGEWTKKILSYSKSCRRVHFAWIFLFINCSQYYFFSACYYGYCFESTRNYLLLISGGLCFLGISRQHHYSSCFTFILYELAKEGSFVNELHAAYIKKGHYFLFSAFQFILFTDSSNYTYARFSNIENLLRTPYLNLKLVPACKSTNH